VTPAQRVIGVVDPLEQLAVLVQLSEATMERVMTDTFLTMTAAQVRAVYDAGRRRGEDEATAYEWGSRAQGKTYDEMFEAVTEIMNDGIPGDSEMYVPEKTVREWFE